MSSMDFPPLTFWKLVAMRTKGETGRMVDKNIYTLYTWRGRKSVKNIYTLYTWRGRKSV